MQQPNTPSWSSGEVEAGPSRRIKKPHLYNVPDPDNAAWRGHPAPNDMDERIKSYYCGSVLLSTDPKLNDPDELFNWIVYQASHVPSLLLTCSGFVGPYVSFDFFVDFSLLFRHQSTILVPVESWEPAERGTTIKCYGNDFAPKTTTSTPTSPGRELTRRERKRWDGISHRLTIERVPLWNGKSLMHRDATSEYLLAPSLEDWCRAYCEDKGLSKSFCIDRGIWGWNLEGLERRVEEIIKATGFVGVISVRLEVFGPELIQVRPSNLFSKVTNGSIHRYAVAHAYMPIKCFPALPGTSPGESIDDARARLAQIPDTRPKISRPPELRQGPKGVHYLVGTREGEWFKEWEPLIRNAVYSGHRGELGRNKPAETELDVCW